MQDELLAEAVNKAKDMDDKELTEYLSGLLSFAIVALRGLHGQEFIEGFLNAAIADTETAFVRKDRKVN